MTSFLGVAPASSSINVAVGADQAATKAVAMADPKVIELLAGATPKKEVIVPGRLVNFVL